MYGKWRGHQESQWTLGPRRHPDDLADVYSLVAGAQKAGCSKYMLPAHWKYVRRFNSVKNPVRKIEKCCAAKGNERMFRELHLIYEIFYECFLTADKFVCGFCFLSCRCSICIYALLGIIPYLICSGNTSLISQSPHSFYLSRNIIWLKKIVLLRRGNPRFQ